MGLGIVVLEDPVGEYFDPIFFDVGGFFVL